MTTIRDYEPAKVDISKKVLLEIGSILKPYQKYCVLVGGWAPYFILNKYKPPAIEFYHCGSLDVDLAIDFRSLPKSEEVYRTIREIIKKNGYHERKDKNGRVIQHSFEREIGGDIIRVDFLASYYGGRGKSHRHQLAQDIMAHKAKGCEIAFKNNEVFPIEGVLPNDARHKTEFKIAGVAAIITMKGYAFDDDISRTKDAYDIFSLLKFYKEGALSAKEEFVPYLRNKLVATSITKIEALFNALKSAGPISAADFMIENRNTPDWEFQRRDVYETVQRFLKEIRTKSRRG